jgi:hypothetical protein
MNPEDKIEEHDLVTVEFISAKRSLALGNPIAVRLHSKAVK